MHPGTAEAEVAPADGRVGRLRLLAGLALLGLVLCGAVRLLGAAAFDRTFVTVLNQFARRSELFDFVVHAIDQLALFQGVAIFTLVCATFVTAERRDRLMLVLGCTAAAVAVALSRVFQHILPENPRPRFDPHFIFTTPFGAAHDASADWSSFPSDHAGLLFGVACSLFLVNRTLGLLGFLIAGVAGLARIYLGLHYPTDVLGGAFLGIASALAAALATERVEHWLPMDRIVRHKQLLAAAGFFLAVQTACLFDDIRFIGAGLRDHLRGSSHATAESPVQRR
ncbi:phosphatase PAP2 family protein [Phenylobacterium sp.]|uniref:phosphatase PAP2 family protein n=1 Tax=Phenylobacterium sp. TaxID=1871053 RepID=UPI002F40121F